MGVFQGKSVLVLGGSRGIGAPPRRRLSREIAIGAAPSAHGASP